MINDETKLKIISLVRKETSVTEISREAKVTRKTVYRYKKILESGQEINFKPKSKAPHKARSKNKTLLKIIKRLCLANPSLSTAKITYIVNAKYDYEISKSTTYNYLKTLKLAGMEQRFYYLQTMLRNPSKSITKKQIAFLSLYNPCYLDYKSNQSNTTIIQLSYFERNFLNKKKVIFFLAVNTHNGFGHLLTDDNLNAYQFHDIITKYKHFKITELEAQLHQADYLSVVKCQLRKLPIRTTVVELKKEEMGMLKRFKSFVENQINHIPAEIFESLSNDRWNFAKLSNEILENWHNTKLSGYPTFDVKTIDFVNAHLNQCQNDH